MGTRSCIGVMHGEKAKVVYCHWDGYILHNGKILQEHYNSARANHLVAMGDMSSLAPNIEAPEGCKHTFDVPHDGVCVFYGRDRKETNAEFQVCQSDEEMFDDYGDCEYFYIMREGVWYVSEGKDKGWRLLSDAIAEEEAIEAQKSSKKLPTERVALAFVIPKIIQQLNEREE